MAISWGKLLQPDLVLGDCILALRPSLLRQRQLKGLILDVDETLVPLRQANTHPDIYDWIEAVKPDTVLWLVSNNINENRIRRIAEGLGVPYLAGAGKPSRRKIRQVVAAMDLPPHQVAIVGDRVFTDVLAGNRLGLYTILVEPMLTPRRACLRHPLRTVEIWLSRLLGATLA